MAAPMKLSLTFVLLLLVSGLVAFGDARARHAESGATCDIQCIQGGNITCQNYKEVIQGCNCVCAPKDGRGCVLTLHSGSTEKCNTKHC